MKRTKDQMKDIITNAGYRVEDTGVLLVITTKSDDYVISIPYSLREKEFESQFVNDILND